jgi:hypothetical protein
MTREQGLLLSLLPMALHRQAMALQWNSAFDRAYTAAQEGYQLALEVGYGAGVHLATLAFVEAVRGKTDEAWAQAQEARQTRWSARRCRSAGSSRCAGRSRQPDVRVIAPTT